MYYHKMDPKFFDEIIPWERELYLDMLGKKVEEENQKMKELEAQRRVKR